MGKIPVEIEIEASIHISQSISAMHFFKTLLLILCISAFGFAQQDVPFCDHQAATSSPTKARTALQKSSTNPIDGGNGCYENNLISGTEPRQPRVIRVKFHVVQDVNGERNFPAGIGSSIFQDVIARSNEKLGDNQPANHHYGNTPPQAQDINIFYEFAGAEYYQSSNWPYNGGNYNDDPNAMNVHLEEDARRWTPQPITLSLSGTSSASSCGASDGSITLGQVDPNQDVTVYFRHNGGNSQSVNVAANGSGNIVVTGLTAGLYEDVHIDYYGQRTNSITASVSESGGASLSFNSTSAPSVCGNSDGGFILNFFGSFGNHTLHYTLDGVAQTASVTPLGNFIFLQNLSTGLYSNVYVETSGGCKSNALSFSIKDNGAPSIGVGSVSLSQCTSGSDGSFEITGLNNGSQTLYVRSNGSGSFSATAITVSGGTFEVDDNNGYYEAYVEENGCRSNTINVRIGQDCTPTRPGGTSGSTGYVNAYHLYHRYLFRTDPVQTPVIGQPYGNSESYNKYLDVFSAVVIHEMGHRLSLPHPFDDDGCDDTPNTPRCDVTNGWFGSNNFMDWNCGPTKRAFTPCQIARMHERLTNTEWSPRWYTCVDPNHTSDVEIFQDNSQGLVFAYNDYSGPTNVQEFFNIRRLSDPGVYYYTSEPFLQFSMMLFEGEDVEICANTRTDIGCIGTEDCETVSVPAMGQCFFNIVGDINAITDPDGVVTSLDPQSLASRPHLWTYTSQNGTELSSTCVHEPDVIYSEAAEYLGDVLDVCVEVLGFIRGSACTTKVCTTIVIPPSIPECDRNGDYGFVYYVSTVDQTPQNNQTALTLEANSFSSYLYIHKWFIQDNRSGQTLVREGRIVELTGRDIAMDAIGNPFDPDLRVCHVVIHRFNDCILGSHCEDINPDCNRSTSYGQVTNLSFDPLTKIVSYTFTLPAGPIQDITYIRNGIVSTPTSVVPSGTNPVTYTVSYQMSTNCGTARIELITESENNSGTRYCSYDQDEVRWGVHPCKVEQEPLPDTIRVVAVVDGDGKGKGQVSTIGKGKRTGSDIPSAYTAHLAPNPSTSGFSTLYINSPVDFNGRVQVMDVQGKVVAQYSEQITEGSHTIRIATTTLDPGLYFVKIDHLQFGVQKLIIK